MASTDDWVRTFQAHLLADARERVPGLSTSVRDAFIAVPRHMFVEEYRTLEHPSYRRVDAANLLEHLPALYRDNGLGIFGHDAASGVTISTPSFVLEMLELLQLSPGMRVFELGTGSGWNAGLLGQLVGPTGYVETVEIIPELATRATNALQRLGLANVNVIAGDGGLGPVSDTKFERAVFTAGSYDIPRRLHEQVTIGGLLLFVLKCPGGGDVLLLLRREEDHFRSVFARPCMFVPVTGPTRDASEDPSPLAALPLWQQLASRQIRTRPLLCGSGRGDFAARTFDLRSFLSIAEPRIRYFLDDADRDAKTPPWAGCTAFGLCLHDVMSIALARGTSIATYGNAQAGDRMDELLRQWLALGMPSAAGLDVRAYPSDRSPQAKPGEWAIERRETCFVWSPRSPV
jgi:protein-L-isoaspartate(D-aspartate) O-methyltransferase